MNDINSFLEMDLKPIYKVVTLPRLHLDFKLRALKARETHEISEELQNEYGDKKIPQHEMGTRYLLASIIEPNLLDERILDKANVNTPYDFLSDFLLDGEYQLLLDTALELSKGSVVNDDLIKKAKN